MEQVGELEQGQVMVGFECEPGVASVFCEVFWTDEDHVGFVTV